MFQFKTFFLRSESKQLFSVWNQEISICKLTSMGNRVSQTNKLPLKALIDEIDRTAIRSRRLINDYNPYTPKNVDEQLQDRQYIEEAMQELIYRWLSQTFRSPCLERAALSPPGDMRRAKSNEDGLLEGEPEYRVHIRIEWPVYGVYIGHAASEDQTEEHRSDAGTGAYHSESQAEVPVTPTLGSVWFGTSGNLFVMAASFAVCLLVNLKWLKWLN